MKILAKFVFLPLLASIGVKAQQTVLPPNQFHRGLQDLLCGACDVYELCQTLGGEDCSLQQIVELACGNCAALGVDQLCDVCDGCTSNENCDFDNIFTLGCSICDFIGGSGDGSGDEPAFDGDPCFSEVATVQVQGVGATAMKDLNIGDQVLTQNGSYETVYAFGHRHPALKAEFLQIYTDNAKHPLEVTPGHLMFVQGKSQPVASETIQVGDVLQSSTSSTDGATVRKISTVTREGLYAPLTTGGTMVVNGVVASSYIDLGNKQQSTLVTDHTLIHVALSPYRMLCKGVSTTFCDTQFYLDNGMPFYVHYGLNLLHWLYDSNPVISAVGITIILTVTGACHVAESMFGYALAPLMVMLLAAAGYIASKSGNKQKGKLA